MVEGTCPDFRRIFEAAPGLYLVLNPAAVIVAVSDDYLSATMTARAELIGRSVFSAFPDNSSDPGSHSVASLRASLERVLLERCADAMAVQKQDLRTPGAEGHFEERYCSPINTPVFGERGEVAYIIHRLEDVTEFVRLKQSVPRGSFTQELMVKSQLIEAEVHRRTQEIEQSNRRLHELQTTLEQRVETGSAVLERTHQALEREIEERKKTEVSLRRAEDHLRQSQKMEAIGRLAGGIAHDFNNLLSVILSYSGVLLEDMEPGANGRSELEQIQLAGTRAASLTRQLLAFSRQQVLEPVVLDLNRVLVDLRPMLVRLLREDVELKMRLATSLPSVKADQSQFEQVIVNLVVNARDAMPEGGVITLESSAVELDAAYTQNYVEVQPGPYVLLCVSDTGIGMDKATQALAFEPFFSTKERGKGTGLGLATVLGIVRQSGGFVWLYSEPGLGTTFKVYLPIVAGSEVLERNSAAPLSTKNDETILLVEDEEAVRDAACTILRRGGYTVIAATSAPGALTICEEYESKIDLLMTDVVMPQMNGRDLAERMLELRPSLRVVFMSGYTDDVVLHHCALDEGAAFIQKPLTPKDLMQRVRDVLDGRTLQRKTFD